MTCIDCHDPHGTSNRDNLTAAPVRNVCVRCHAEKTGPFVFESIGSDTDADNDYSFASFTPSSPLLFSEITDLSAAYAFTLGDCHGGALRWSVRVSERTPTSSGSL